MTRVYISPPPGQVDNTGGVGRVVLAQHERLGVFGVEIVGKPEDAEIVAAHITGEGLPRVDVLHSHGLYWTGDPGSGQYNDWHHRANQLIIAAARKAYVVTVPSAWVAMPYRRDMRIDPPVVPHGVDLAQHRPGENKGYILFNKNRAGDVCDPAAAVALAQRGAQVVTTFVRSGTTIPDTLQIIGLQPFDSMRRWVSEAGVYLATTCETFGIGTVEALASGVPVLGYAWGGTADIVEHEKTGYLVRPGDVDGLAKGLAWIENNRAMLSANCLEAAQRYTWDRVMRQYADLYAEVAERKQSEKRGVSVVITNYNYGRYVGEAIKSCLDQSVPPQEIIIVDDGSSDSSLSVIQGYVDSKTDDQGVFRPVIRSMSQTNQGVATARNAGIGIATQAHVICLDADDKLDPRFIQTLLPVMQADRGLGIAYTGIKLLWEDGRQTASPFPPPFDWEVQATPGNPPPTCIPSGSMFRRDMWVRAGGYQQWAAPGEDTEFWTRGLSVGFEARKVSEEGLFHYRLHEGQAHKTKTYQRIDNWHPWMRDRQYPMAAPSQRPPLVRSYQQPLISVVIPVGPGHVKYLPSALDSLLGQTFRNWEVIIVDDTLTVEKWERDAWTRIAQVYPFVRYHSTIGARAPTRTIEVDGITTIVERKHRTGAAAARNIGLEHAKGRFTLFLDADDYLMPDALRQMLLAFVESGGKYAYTDWLALEKSGNNPKQCPDFDAQAWLRKGQHAVTALMLTADVRGVGGFDEAMQGWEDWDFFIKVVLSGICGVRVPQVLMGYRMQTGQRRETSLQNKDALLALLDERYGAYRRGDKPMPSCCGGSGDAIMAAKDALNGGGQSRSLPSPAPEPGVQGVTTPPTVRMQFVGDQVGSTEYRSEDGRRAYRGGNNPNDRYANVLPQDVEWLERWSEWKRVGRMPPAPPIEAPPEQPAPTSAPVWGGRPPELVDADILARMLDTKEAAPAAPVQGVPTEGNPWGLPDTPPPDPATLAAENEAITQQVRAMRRGRESVK